MDIRLDTGFLGNLKTRKLLRDLGVEGPVCLIRLWCYVGERHPKGALNGISEDDLEEIAGWSGERGAFASYAVRMRWVDRGENGALSIHDWKEHQPYIFHSDKRSEAARDAAVARWEGKRKRVVNAKGKRGASGAHAGGNAPAPAPAPDPKPENKVCGLSSLRGNSDGAAAPGGVLEAPPGAAPIPMSEEVLRAQAELVRKRRELGLAKP